MTTKTVSALLLILLVFAAAPPGVAAQAPEGVVRISVQDQTGATIPFAQVRLTNEAGVSLAGTPNDRGVVTITGVGPGAWRLTVEAGGFQSLEQAITVGRAPFEAAVQLPVSMQEEIFVDDSSAPDRSGNAFARTLSADEIDALPDDPDEMADALRQMAGPGAQIFVDGFGGGRLPPKNQIQQIRFRTNSFSAENHQAGMVRIDVITRPGMTGFGGMANVGFRDEALNARNVFAPEKAPEQQRRFMVNFGGPLVANRTSFRLSVDGEMSYDSRTILAALPGETLSSQVRRPVDTANVRLRVDHALGQNNQLMAQYERRNGTRENLGVGDFDLPDRAFTTETVSDQIRVTNNRVLGAKAFNEFRVSFTASSTAQTPFSDAPTVRVLEAFTLGGAGQSGVRESREFEVANNVDFTVGRHAMRAGVLLEGGSWDSTSASNTNGMFTFGSVDDYLRGRPSLFAQRIGEAQVSYRHLQAGWFLQDDFRIGRNLSLGLGVRQEVQTHLADAWNIAPRAAFTWTPGGGPLNIRGGWGIFYDWYETSLYEQTLRLDGTRQEEVIIVNPGYPEAGLGVGQALPSSVIRVGDDLVMPTIQQMSIGFDRTLTSWLTVRADYLRLRGANTLRSINVNAPVDGVRPDAAFGNISQIVATGESHTDRVSVGLSFAVPQRRMSANVMYQYGTSKNFADSALSLPSDNRNPEADWGPSAQDVRHRVFLMGSVPLPLGVRVMYQVQGASALPYTITTGTDDNGDTVFNDRPAGVGRNSARGSATWNGNIRIGRGFNLGGRASGPGAGPMGPGGGGPGPGVSTMGGGGGGGPMMMIMEGGASRYRLDVYLQAFNVFNHTNYNQFVGNLRSPFYGTATSAAPARRIEIGATFGF
ncbi:MAG: carboxypeptidase-like regulatory domain-containing protein [Vicinamibacterales bacterium]|nr:carboxypeptidase-like regulatory domain-containing protein [Vicinamibacterales bacterium]